MTMKTQNSYVVSVPPRLSGSQLHVAIAHLGEVEVEEVEIKMGSLSFAFPPEVCGLRALVEHAATRSGRVSLDCPSNQHVHRYLERMNLYSDLPGNVDLSQPRPGLMRRDQSGKLIELVSVSSTNDVEDLMDRVSKIAEGQVGRGPVARAFTTAIGAITENVVDHAASPIGALIAAQRYRTSGLEFSVVDLGDGIPSTLTSHPDYSGLHDLEALELALKDGVSSTGVDGRGVGLWEFVEHIGRGGNATIGIASGQADLRISWSGGRQTRNAATPVHPVPGTWISVRLQD
jgi:hypothetical protein